MGDTFEPRIVGFLCNWCIYAGADLAGTSRSSYPANVRIVRVPCRVAWTRSSSRRRSKRALTA